MTGQFTDMAVENQKRDALARTLLAYPSVVKQLEFLRKMREHNSQEAVADITTRMRRIDPVKTDLLEREQRRQRSEKQAGGGR